MVDILPWPVNDESAAGLIIVKLTMNYYDEIKNI
jgi:hypothetical protein